MPADHHQADGEGCRQHQPDRPPQPGPERRRKHDGDGRGGARPYTWGSTTCAAKT